MIVWDLFGGSENSVYHAVGDKHTVYTIDITEPQRKNQIKFDLSQPFEIIKKRLDKLPHPDIICASPLCQSFTSIMRFKKGEHACYTYSDNTIALQTPEAFEKYQNPFIPNNWLHFRQNALLGVKLLINTYLIISHYQPNYWYIENPRNGLMWHFIDVYFRIKAFANACTYSSYGYPTMKPTIFLSNTKLNLKYEPSKRCDLVFRGTKHRKGLNNRKKNEHGIGVSIPKSLILDIFTQWLDLSPTQIEYPTINETEIWNKLHEKK